MNLYRTLCLLVVLTIAAIAPVSAVLVSFDNATCGIHIQKDIHLNEEGVLTFNASDFPETNCLVFATTDNFVTKPAYYNPTESQRIRYSDEYNLISSLAEKYFHGFNWDTHTTNGYPGRDTAMAATYLELRRQTILIEKQNELLNEQNLLLRGTRSPEPHDPQ